MDEVQPQLAESRALQQIHIRRLLPVILWTIVIFIGCYVSSIVDLMNLSGLSFQFSMHVDWLLFFRFSDMLLGNPQWYVTKFGHFVCFAIEEALLYKAFKKRKLTVIGAISLAVLTEIIQIPFGRDGRLYDVLIDSAGALTVWWYTSKKYMHKFW